MAGCSMDDVELNGSLFKAAGIGQGSSKGAEPKMTARSGLVVPPNLERLPAPGAQPGAESAEVAAIADPDVAANVSREELERQQAEYCSKHYDTARAHGDQVAAEVAEGPLGSCRGSLFNLLKSNGGQ
jgi:hypothetical protein